MVVGPRPRAAALFAITALAVTAAGASAYQSTQARTQAVTWMAGCWERATPRSVVNEQWMRPSGGLLMGMSRTVRRTTAGDSLREFEFLRIFERGGKLVYAAQPQGRPPTEFTEAQLTDSSITFENLAHDFPQRIIYRKRPDSLVARIEGPRGGQTQGIDFPYGKVACP